MTSDHFERKGCKKTLKQREGRCEASKELKTEDHKYRKKGRQSSVKITKSERKRSKELSVEIEEMGTE